MDIQSQHELVTLFTEWIDKYKKEINRLRCPNVLIDSTIGVTDLIGELDVIAHMKNVHIRLCAVTTDQLMAFRKKVVLCIGQKRSMFTRYGQIKIYDYDLGDLTQVWEIPQEENNNEPVRGISAK